MTGYAPCKDCQERAVGCHAKCEKYPCFVRRTKDGRSYKGETRWRWWRGNPRRQSRTEIGGRYDNER